MTRRTQSSANSMKLSRRVDPQRLRRTLSGMRHKGCILLVDDDRHDLEAIRIKLGIVLGPGIDVVAARSLRTAIDTYDVHGGRFDILLLNHLLKPQGTGLELLAALSEHPKPPAGAKSVLYSSRMDPSLAQSAAKAGFHAAVSTDEFDSMSAMAELLWRLVKPDIDWSASWRGLP